MIKLFAKKLFLFSIILLLSFVLLFPARTAAQDIDITPALQLIETGKIKDAETILQNLKLKNSSDPSVLFLDAVLTKDGNEAIKKYSFLLEKHPDSKFTDAVLYRIFSYYYSLGYYKKAETYLDRLKNEFPQSNYIASADRKIPDIEETEPQPTKPQTSNVQSEKKEIKNYNFTIQAGAFLSIDNAKNLCDQLNKENYFAEITTKEIGGSILNVVNVGRFVSEDETKPVLSFLEKKFNLKGRVISINR